MDNVKKTKPEPKHKPIHHIKQKNNPKFSKKPKRKTYERYGTQIINGRERVLYVRTDKKSRAKYLKHHKIYIKLSDYKKKLRQKQSGGGINWRDIPRNAYRNLKYIPKFIIDKVKNFQEKRKQQKDFKKMQKDMEIGWQINDLAYDLNEQNKALARPLVRSSSDIKNIYEDEEERKQRSLKSSSKSSNSSHNIHNNIEFLSRSSSSISNLSAKADKLIEEILSSDSNKNSSGSSRRSSSSRSDRDL